MARVIGSARWSEWPLKVFRLNNIWTPKYVCYKEGKKENPGRGEEMDIEAGKLGAYLKNIECSCFAGRACVFGYT